MVEVQDIFQMYGEEYRQKHRLSYAQSKAMSAIQNCRTAKMGGHTDICDNCGHTQISYNSCRNRHCPKCQALAKERWIDGQKSCLLNVGYFHVVFTLPDELNSVIYQNQKTMYTLLFQVVAETLQELAADKRVLGATLGFTSVLHTWGQQLLFHPHIHCIVPAGGLNHFGQWVNSRKKFFLPVKVLSRKFRGKFLAHLKSTKLEFHGTQKYLADATNFQHLMVSFKWRDYKDNRVWKVLTVTVEEIMRRFLLHILPLGFMKIRHYGLLGNRNKNTKLMRCKQLTLTPIVLKEKASTLDLIRKIMGKDICKCPACGCDRLHHYMGLSPPATA